MKSGQGSSAIRWVFLLVLGILLNLVFLAATEARMGGGHSYSGGSSGGGSGSSGRSSGGGSGGSSGGFHWGGGSSSSGFSGRTGSLYTGSGQPEEGKGKFTLFIEIVILILVIYVLIRLLSHSSFSGPVSTVRSSPPGGLANLNASLDEQVEVLKSRDDNFSKVLLIDFVCLIYHKFYTFRGTEQFRMLQPYLSKLIVDQTTSNVFYQQQRIHEIVIGKAKIINIFVRGTGDNILVEFESNLTLQYLKTQDKTRLINRERWLFSRQAGLVSPQPEQMRTLSCPNCGAPADFTDAGECQYCHSFIHAGEKQWQVSKIDIIDSQPFKTENPGGYVEEAGTGFPTVVQTGLNALQQTFLRKHDLGDWKPFYLGFCDKVVKPYFLATYAAWSQGDWRKARHLVSDRLYESNGFWMDEYARQGWRNSLENIVIENIEIARIDMDAFYEALTVRVFASCLDYTIDREGKLLGGSVKKPRRFSEYWTFMRTAGVEKIEQVYDLKSCPSCGAPADKVGQTGVCAYCGSKITEGHFSWVLATITQDEVYEG